MANNVVNLNRFRKEKERGEEAAKAAENRATHGRSKAEKSLLKAHDEKSKRILDQHRRETDEP
jgi:hypothetical protein